MTDLVRIPSYGPLDAEYAVVGQSPGAADEETGHPFSGTAGERAREWLAGAGLGPDDVRYMQVYEYVLKGKEKPTSTDVKHGVERVRGELAEMPNLKGVILFGGYAARLAFKLVGGITRVSGQKGVVTLADGREINCIACVHPSYVLHQRSLRIAQTMDNECRGIVARLMFIDEPVVLPEITLKGWDAVPAGKVIGLDVETASQVGKKVDPRRDPILCTTLSDGTTVLGRVEIDPKAEPVIWNQPFDALEEGVWDAKWHDPKMLAHLQGEPDTSMKGMATKRLNQPMMEYDPLLRAKAANAIERKDMDDPDLQEFLGYGVQDAIAHRALLDSLLNTADEGTKWVYENIERPMMRLYAKWSMLGVFRVDRAAALKKRDALDQQSRKMRRELKAATGVESPHAHAKLAAALRLPSTSAVFVKREWKSLNKTQRKVIKLISDLRSLERQNSTYIDAWLEWDLPLISTLWRPTAAWTGRPGSAFVNLQNIPGPCESCKDCRKGNPLDCIWNLKPLLLPPEGSVLYELDNSQAELRVAAHNTQDKNMIRAFTEGIEIDGEVQYDLHEWARAMLNIPSRRDAKIRVLATFYGSSTVEGGVAETIHNLFPGYMKWSRKVKRMPVVPGLFGRKLHVPPHPNDAHREREAINAPSQGGAVDVLKLQTDRLEGKGFDTRHMIHDSTLVRVDEADAGRDVEETMRETMETAVKLSVPLKVGVGKWPLH